MSNRRLILMSPTSTHSSLTLSRNLLDHLARPTDPRTRTRGIDKQSPGRTLQNLPWDCDLVAFAAASPANENRIGLPDSVFPHLQGLLADGGKILAVGLAGLFFEQLVDCLLLQEGYANQYSLPMTKA